MPTGTPLHLLDDFNTCCLCDCPSVLHAPPHGCYRLHCIALSAQCLPCSHTDVCCPEATGRASRLLSSASWAVPASAAARRHPVSQRRLQVRPPHHSMPRCRCTKAVLIQLMSAAARLGNCWPAGAVEQWCACHLHGLIIVVTLLMYAK
jgi:hypothetical protein